MAPTALATDDCRNPGLDRRAIGHGRRPSWAPAAALAAGLILFLASPVFAQRGRPAGALYSPPRVVFDRLDAENLLPQSSVYDLVERRDGYLWLVTLDGLVRFDGVRAKIFDRNNAPQLATSRLSALWDDKATGELWLGTEDGRLAVFADGAFTTFPAVDPALGAVTGLRIGAAGHLFVFYQKGAAELADGRAAGGERLRLVERLEGLGDYGCGKALLGADGRLWQAGDQGFFAIPLPAEMLPSPGREQCQSDARGGLWLRSAAGLLFRADGPNLREDERGRRLPPGAVPFAEDADGSLWVKLPDAPRIGRLDGTGRLRFYGEEAGVDPIGEAIRGYYDREGGFWIASDTALYRYQGEAIGGLELRHPGGSAVVASHFESADGTTLVADRDLRLWVLSPGGQLQELTTRDAKGRLVLRPDLTVDAAGQPFKIPRVAPRQSQDFAELDGAIYVGTDSSLMRWRDGRLTLFPIGPYDPERPAIAGGINDILVEDGGFWLATAEAVVRFEGERAVRVWGPAEGVASSALTLLRDGQGRLLAGTRFGVLRLEGERFVPLPGLGLEIGQARALWEDAAERLWVGTYAQGLFRLLPNGKVEHAGPDQGFSGGVFTIRVDRRGFLWTTSNRGLLRSRLADVDRLLTSGSGKAPGVLYGRSAGLPSSECNGGFGAAGYDCRNGAYCVQTLGGIAVARLEEVRVVFLPPVPAIEGAEVDGEARAIENGELRLAPDDRNVLLRFSGSAFEGADHLAFRYRLRGYDADWVDTDGRREALFGDLPPGHYPFEVEAESREGVISPRPARLLVEVAPAWWERHSVRGLLLAAVVAAAWAGMRLRVRLLSLRHARREVELRGAAEELEKRVRERTAELDAEIVERRRAEDEARLASATKSAFLAQMSHELRTPMNAIIGLSEILERSPLTPQQHEWVKTVCASGEALLSIIEDILDFSRIEAGRLEIEARRFSPTEVVAEAVRIVGTLAAAKGLDLAWEAEPDVPRYAIGDAGRLRQVLLNLLGNAVKFTHRGRIEVRLAARETENGWLLEIAVADTGIGIAPEAQARIFEPFTQADASMSRRFGGSGLGLAICRRVIGALGGRLRLESRLGAGSTFTIECPVARPPEGDAAEDRADGHRDSGLSPLPGSGAPLPPGWRVLIAEDDVVNQLVARSLLEALGLESVIAGSGDAALERLEEEAFEVVLMDLHMPGKSGLETSRLIRATLPADRQPYLIALTAAVTPEDRADCRAAGMEDFLAKPIREQDLRAALERAASAKKNDITAT